MGGQRGAQGGRRHLVEGGLVHGVQEGAQAVRLPGRRHRPPRRQHGAIVLHRRRQVPPFPRRVAQHLRVTMQMPVSCILCSHLQNKALDRFMPVQVYGCGERVYPFTSCIVALEWIGVGGQEAPPCGGALR